MAVLPNSETYFYTPALKGLMQQLVHLAYFGDGFSVVLGARYAGKSRLAEELVKHFDQAHDVVSIALQSSTELGESLERISAALGLAASGNLSIGEMLTDLRHFAQALAQDKKLVVLIVDDAHYFDDQAIGALVSLLQGKSETNFGLHVVLLSEPGLEERIDALQILDVAVYDFAIPPFSPSELATFLSARNTSVQALTSSQIQKIWAASRGLPGVALYLLKGEQVPAADTPPAAWYSQIPLAHIAAVVLLALILLWSLLWHSGRDTPEVSGVIPPHTAEGVDLSSVTEAISNSALVEGEGTIEEVSVEEVSGERDDIAPMSVIEQHNSEQPRLEFNRESGDIKTPSEREKAVAPEAEGSLPAASAPLSASAESNASAATPTLPRLNDAAPDRDISPQELEPVAVEGSVAEGSPATVAVQASTKADDLTDQEAFLLAQNPEFYALQVIAASKKESLEAYVERQANKAKLKMYRGTREGKSWFVVVEGVYSTRASAMQGRNMLPKEQVKAGPWPRPFSQIHEEIETFRRK